MMVTRGEDMHSTSVCSGYVPCGCIELLSFPVCMIIHFLFHTHITHGSRDCPPHNTFLFRCCIVPLLYTCIYFVYAFCNNSGSVSYKQQVPITLTIIGLPEKDSHWLVHPHFSSNHHNRVKFGVIMCLRSWATKIWKARDMHGSWRGTPYEDILDE